MSASYTLSVSIYNHDNFSPLFNILSSESFIHSRDNVLTSSPLI
ncbi:hypothetical protein YPPY36_1922 [Yersinia pestis PY-36]|nr:hypothetical protein YPPY02_1721 [Yersinia pestis PY-02]EIR05513.1 hypothetical protein YPPY05_1730 [Yersinia pestis PY-05]EIR08453.1 hypothetical protein YPPY06_1768 [Yersinia pestis PY-06]EIR35659.1 hypothetical protein YPPY12_1923 [Yersinia pestis PY-12]EIR35745.1 hypothetical protein YPPY11_1854 [Yersinia pestis PY-11]EIR90846.1 hypothetical protein YPPY36_1922 [Yersinia pestis PY-36]EIR94089.1 hypothetical protein YPPY45_1678 [Yersinia pestis PY-45]EIS20100.1 hypothetical protein YPP